MKQFLVHFNLILVWAIILVNWEKKQPITQITDVSG